MNITVPNLPSIAHTMAEARIAGNEAAVKSQLLKAINRVVIFEEHDVVGFHDCMPEGSIRNQSSKILKTIGRGFQWLSSTSEMILNSVLNLIVGFIFIVGLVECITMLEMMNIL